jgi:hypothetical protein
MYTKAFDIEDLVKKGKSPLYCYNDECVHAKDDVQHCLDIGVSPRDSI